MVDCDCRTNDKALREQIVKSALDSFDWEGLRAHFDDISLSSVELSKVCGHIRRFSKMISKYPQKGFEGERDQFFDELRSFADATLGTEAADQVTSELALIKFVERGYRGVLDQLASCDISKKSGMVRVSAAISRACYEYQDLMRRRDQKIANSEYLNVLSANVQLENEAGSIFSADGVVEGLSETLAMTLIMEAHKNAWFDGDIVVLPELTTVDDTERFQAGSTQIYAVFWRHWQRIEKRRRYWGGEIREVQGDERPDELRDDEKVLMEYIPSDDRSEKGEMYDYLANTRLRDRLVQTFMEMQFETGLPEQIVGIGAGAALPPRQFVSAAEGHACVSLCEILGYSIVDDQERLGGLRLIEWVRGYAVLQEIAKSRTEQDNLSGDDFAILLKESELMAMLTQCGLSHDRASEFITRTCLSRASQDMFDTPLVRVGPSRYLLFAPSVTHMGIAVVVLSSLSSLGEALSRRGNAFEQSVRRRFQEFGFKCFTFKAHRDGEEFEYDAVVPWDDHLFIFECKNRSLSGNDPVQAYYFDQQVSSHAKQVRRQAEALRRFPDIVDQNIGPEYVGMTVVPCVLNSLPYSQIGTTDEVYFTDASALFRFFDKRDITINCPHRLGKTTILHRVPVSSFWSGDEPTVADFLKHLAAPHQLVLQLKHLRKSPIYTRLSDSEFARMNEWSICEMTPESICEAMGVDANAVMQEIDAVAEVTDELHSDLEGTT